MNLTREQIRDAIDVAHGITTAPVELCWAVSAEDPTRARAAFKTVLGHWFGVSLRHGLCYPPKRDVDAHPSPIFDGFAWVKEI